MTKNKKNKKVNKEFGLSSWAINNKTTMYVLIALILFLGASAYFSMPRESFPEIKETKIYISSVYPGNTAEDIEKLITDPIEDKLKTVSNVVEITSTSQEDYSIVIVEFDENIPVEAAKQKNSFAEKSATFQYTQFKKKKNVKNDKILPTNLQLIKKFLDVLSQNLKQLSSMSDSMMLLAFLN